jgi:hypothetical protein
MSLSREERRMRLTDERINEFLNSLQGTCQGREFVFNELADYYKWGFEYDDLNVEEEERLDHATDDALFLCGNCGWWCETGDWIIQKDYVGHEICSQCGEFDENNEDYEPDEDE